MLIDLGRNYLYTRRLGLAENQEVLFVAPEVKENSKTNASPLSGFKSDLYSFGMIIIELVKPRRSHIPLIPDSLYQHAPALARFIEDLVDNDPTKRLLIC